MDLRQPEFDTRLLIYLSRQIILGVIILATVFGFALFIQNGMENKQHWLVIGIPLCIAATAFILFPKTEEWEYKAWQGKARRVEQNFDR
ncbi:MAG: hypothetical protein ACOH5I_16115 [Oligoflexus sp.]